jgi:ABC-type multidrug transport system fused ATPase/permease subunit
LPRKWLLLFGFLLMVAGTIASLVPPYLTKSLLDIVLVPAAKDLNSVRFSQVVVLYIARYYARMDGLIRIVVAVQRAGASAQRIFAILDRTASVAEPTEPVHTSQLRGEIDFRNVSFHNGNRFVLQDIDLKVQPGEMIGLVGPSGAGKTTLVNLICRFYDVAEGAIAVDGVDIRSYPLEEYRRNIGIVLQEPFLFFGSIAENIAYGRPDASRAEIIATAEAANAHEFICRLSGGYLLSSVPEPSTIALLCGAGIAGTLWRYRRQLLFRKTALGRKDCC